MATEGDVLKVLVDDALSRGVHPDATEVLKEWREDNTTDQERDDALPDAEYVNKYGYTRADAKDKPAEKLPAGKTTTGSGKGN